MSKKQPLSIHRRALMSRMAMVGAASLLEPGTSAAQQPSTSRETETPSSTPPSTLPPRTAPSAAAPSAREIAADQQAPAEERLYVGRSGSDRMVDSIKQLDIDYVATMPGSSFRGLHESLINYGQNKQPELLTCLHEEISVAIGVEAQNPVIVADMLVRSEAGMQHLVELAEALQAPVVDRYSRLNMPNDHYLNHSERERTLIGQADVILGLEVRDLFGVVNSFSDKVERTSQPLTRPNAKLISITSKPLLIKSNFQDFQRYQPVDIYIAGDGETTLPHLAARVMHKLDDGNSSREDRGARLRQLRDQAIARSHAEASYGWTATPISVARLCAEIWPVIRDDDWALVGGDSQFRNYWPQKLWTMTKPYQYSGGSGGAGVGYGAPAAVGSALAHRDHGRLPVNIQGDGDLMCCAGALWTAAHHHIPLLTVMHNNRAYHQELMHVQRMANRHERGITRANIGTVIDGPAIDFAKLAQSMGVWAIGPITEPDDLSPALRRAAEVVRRGQPALVDVVTQGR
jgi:acetolactate synthase I/II/III large subunit